jgi:serine/threonine-protein kinase
MMRALLRQRRLLFALTVSVACGAGASISSSARADSSLADKAAAQSLYDEGRKLMTEGKFAQACPKLAESQKLDPGVGTQFHLADCYEHLGQTASAWAGFLEAASSAKSMGQGDRERVARDRAAALAPRLSKLTIVSPGAEKTAGLEIKRDGAVVGHALWGTAIPIDPGPHTLEATAPGKKPWQGTVQVEGEKTSVVGTIPALEDAPPGSAASASSSVAMIGADSSAGGGRRTLGLVIGGVGIVGVGVGTVFALQAKSKYNESLSSCHPDDKNVCSSEGLTVRDQARSAGNVATVVMGVGGAALVAGAVLFLTAPSASSETPRVSVVPSVAPGAAGLVAVGTY